MPLINTVAAVATPPGKGGIAAIRISGPQSISIAAKVFTSANKNKALQNMQGYTAAFGSYLYRGKQVDEGVALCYRAPHSYTGEDVVELFCHGGEEVSREVLLACIEAGAAPAGPGEFTKRALLNGKMSLTQAEAVMELISATSSQGVQVARAALGGALATQIQTQKQQLTNLAGHLAAYTDYPEEDVETLTKDEFITTLQQVGAVLDDLIANYHKGSIVRSGVPAAIVGSPNVGKSTLFNLLSGYQRAIVTEVAGTTRDVLREQIQIGGIALHLADTAGLHDTKDVVEAEGIKRSYDEIENANLIIAVFDGSQRLQQEELELAEMCAGRPALGIINKSDLGTQMQPEQLQKYFRKVLVVSAKSPQTRPMLEQAVLEILELDKMDPSQALLANQRQLAAVVEARKALQQAEDTLLSGFTFDAAGVFLEDGISALAVLTGENATESIIDDVFSRFCVGK
ncbi:tRNA uridine-5-carboxymethylaminomethyl(34) synthesis GTPase MnmE [Ruminococcaceae bacterium OttesenSCG-928-A16]|nr:tRNA uridine-5-carboxymethylaminomethyl(34) synthesis GTPase MnmE [Ruminococcaceae bacterium OttesenSCG-928-A16]